MWRVIGCITQEHDLRLVALAACICALACGTTLNLLARAWNVRPGSSWAWLFAAAAVFGGGVWSLHFVAMLAFTPGVEIGYAIPTTIASILVAIGGAFASFVAWRFSRDRPAGILVGGILLGLAVSAMHYTGVAAMRIAGGLHLDAPTVLASIAFGVTFAV
jgi:NO-binding membrane sensor protein with MHYT domain